MRVHAHGFNSYLTARGKVQSVRIGVHYQGFKNINAIPECKYQPMFVPIGMIQGSQQHFIRYQIQVSKFIIHES